MLQVRVHGRGGQGVVTAAELLSADLHQGKGCGICVEESPSGASAMEPETI